MKHFFIFAAIIVAFSAKAQSLYVKNFGSSFSSWTFSTNYSGGVTDNGGSLTKSCTFANGDDITGMGTYARYTRSNIYDPVASSYDWLWDSIVFKFKYRTDGYALNFRVVFDFLVGAGSTYEYDVLTHYEQPDSANVKVIVSGPTGNALNAAIGLIKTDTTLNDFTINLSNLSVMGYITYSATGLSEHNDPQDAVFCLGKTLFFSEKWLNKHYRITDIMGKEYISGTVNSGEEVVDLQHGMYILRTESSVQRILITE